MRYLLFDKEEIILLSLTAGLFLIQILFLFLLYNKIGRRRTKEQKNKLKFNEDFPPISVIIYSHEQSEDLWDSLPPILEQDYPEFEVIVINDKKDDDTNDILKQISAQYPNLYHSFLADTTRYISRKKLAIHLGIKASKYDWLVLTEPDCHPVTNQWLKLLARNFTADTEVVLGFSCYPKSKNGFERYVCFENLITNIRFLSMGLMHIPFMGMGKNLAYRKDAFYKQKGFTLQPKIQGGDDDLMVRAMATNKNTRVETNQSAVVLTNKMPPKYEWEERKLLYSTSRRYNKGFHSVILAFDSLTKILFYLTDAVLVASALMHLNLPLVTIGILLFLLYFICLHFTINRSATLLGDSSHYHFSLLYYDFILPFDSLRWRLRSSKNNRDYLWK